MTSPPPPSSSPSGIRVTPEEPPFQPLSPSGADAPLSPPEKEYAKVFDNEDSDDDVKVRDSNLAWRRWLRVIRYASVVLTVGVVLAIPIIVFRNDQDFEVDESLAQRQKRNLVFYVFLWLEIVWLSAVLTDLIMLLLPHVFWLVARYVNPAHQRYWRVFRYMRSPVVLLGTILGASSAFDPLLLNNDQLAVNYQKAPDSVGWDDVLYDVLIQIIFWVVFYNVEKIGMLYITIHYHYRADQTRNTHSKKMHKALATLYEASVYLHPVDGSTFALEDAIIHHPSNRAGLKPSRFTAGKFLRRLGFGDRGIGRFFGNFDPDSHWLNPHNSYGVVERALGHPKSAAALANRIWRSLTLNGSDTLTAGDVAEVLGPYRRDEALECFNVLDENGSKDIRHDEFVWTVIEVGRVRSAIYEGMAATHHCLNTLDWVALFSIAFVMIFWILVLYVPVIKDIQNTVSFLAVGLSFTAGRTVHKFLSGCIFVFFDHPFDIGDCVEVFNIPSTKSFSCIVTGQSILYTVFQRLDTRTIVQLPNDRLSLLRLDNITRSGANNELRTISIHPDTTFQDLIALRDEMEMFLKDEANSRDYFPTLVWNVSDIPDLKRIDVRFSFKHKNNWSNDQLRARRSSRFVCALMAAVRKLGIQCSGTPRGDERRPIYQVSVPLEEIGRVAEKGKKVFKQDQVNSTVPEELAARELLTTPPTIEKETLTKGDEVDTTIWTGSTGLRARNRAEGGLMHYP